MVYLLRLSPSPGTLGEGGVGQQHGGDGVVEPALPKPPPYPSSGVPGEGTGPHPAQ